MSVLFKSTAKKNPQALNEPAKYYATAVNKGKSDIDYLSKLVAQASTVSKADTYAVLISLIEVITNELSQGRSVHLGMLGHFKISLQSKGADSPQQLTSDYIKKAKINYRPGQELTDMLNNLKYEKASKE